MHDFRTQGAFLLSAVRKEGATRWVRVRSLAGEPLKLRHGITGRVTVHGAHARSVGDGVLELKLAKDQEAFIAAANVHDFVVEPSDHRTRGCLGSAGQNGRAPMSQVSRRTFVSGVAAAAVVVPRAPPGHRGLRVSAARARSPSDVHGRILADAAMKWRGLPASWQSAPFFGNGFLAAHLYSAAGEGNVLRIMLNHSLVQDQRGQWEAAIGYSRLPVGYLTLTFAGTITAVDWSLEVATAELSGTVTTTAGSVRMRILILHQDDVLLVSLEPSAGEHTAGLGFLLVAVPDDPLHSVPAEYTANPDPARGPGFVEQSMDAGGGYTTAWREVQDGSGRCSRPPSPTASRSQPAASRRWRPWTGRSPPTRMSWCAAPEVVGDPAQPRSDPTSAQRSTGSSSTRWRRPLARTHPCCRSSARGSRRGTNWTNIWWNLNTQVAYPMINGSNHLELDAITPTFRKYHRNLELNVDPAYRDGKSYALCRSAATRSCGPVRAMWACPAYSPNDHTGNLTWGMHNVWLSYRHSMDQRILRDVLYPVLTAAIAYYTRFLTEGTDGLLHCRRPGHRSTPTRPTVPMTCH